MEQIELILISLLIGAVLRLTGRLPDNATKVLAGWVINVALPAAALRSIHDVSIDRDWLIAAATPWIGVVVAIAVIVPIVRRLNWSRQRAGALLLVAGWGNTSFVGLPMIAALAGPQWLGLGLVIDLFGSYLALSIIGIGIATICSSGAFDARTVLRKILTFPPFIAIVIAMATNHMDRPDWIDTTARALAETLTPVALVAVGFALRLGTVAGRWAALGVGLTFRLVVAPFAILLFYLLIGGLGEPTARIAILEMAMPPMLGASIIAMDHDLEPDLVTLLIGLGVPISIGTTQLWWALLQTL